MCDLRKHVRSMVVIMSTHWDAACGISRWESISLKAFHGRFNTATRLQAAELAVEVRQLVGGVAQRVGVAGAHVLYAADVGHRVGLAAPRRHHVQAQQPLPRRVQVAQQRALPA